MDKITATDPESHSEDLIGDNVKRLATLFPDAMVEGKVDFDVLKQLLGDTIDGENEKYGLTWHGKRRARQLALTPSTGTLRPCPDESVDWNSTQNLMIEGDNLEVLKLLQKSYAGKVKLIYIDPPYNTGKDFVYPDNFQDSIQSYLEITRQVDAGGTKLSTNLEASGRFHTAWLNMMYPRLRLARELLTEDGVLFVSIDDHEADHLRELLREVFHDENFLVTLIWNKQHSQQQGIFKQYHEYVVVVSRDASALGNIQGGDGEIDAGALKKVSAGNPKSEFTFPAGVRFEATDGFELTGTYGESEKVEVISGRMRCLGGKTTEPVTLSAGWTQKNQMASWFRGEETLDSKGQRVLEFYFSSSGKLKCRKERASITPPSILPPYGMVSEQTEYLRELMGGVVFATPKPVQMLRDFISWFTSERDIVMDFFAGSGTTGEALLRCEAEGLRGRRYLLVQLPEPLDVDDPAQREAAEYCDGLGVRRRITELTKERLRRAGVRVRSEYKTFGGDLGFRVFKLDSSNIAEWDPDTKDVAGSLDEHIDHLKTDRSETDILFELLLKLGLELTVPIETRVIAGKQVHSVGAGTLMVCLAASVALPEIEELATGMIEWHQALAPGGDTTVVFRDDAFADDVAKTNLVETLVQHGFARKNIRSL